MVVFLSLLSPFTLVGKEEGGRRKGVYHTIEGGAAAAAAAADVFVVVVEFPSCEGGSIAVDVDVDEVVYVAGGGAGGGCAPPSAERRVCVSCSASESDIAAVAAVCVRAFVGIYVRI